MQSDYELSLAGSKDLSSFAWSKLLIMDVDAGHKVYTIYSILALVFVILVSPSQEMLKR